MPVPSDEVINTAILLTVPGSVLLACLLIVFLNPTRSLAGRVVATIIGFVVGTAAMALAFWIAMLLAVAFAVIAEDVAHQIVVAVGVVLLAVPGAFCIAISARVTQALCLQWKSDLFTTRVPSSSDRLLALGWTSGLSLGLIATLAVDSFLPLGIGAIGGTLMASGLILRQRHRDQ